MLYPPIVSAAHKEDIMSNLIPGNGKHLTLDNRKYIEQALNDGSSFKDIARYLCKDPTTISKEVKLHRSLNTWNRGSFNNPYNFCTKRFTCMKTNVCDKLIICDNQCRNCHLCNQTCKSFVLEYCPRMEKAPFVCNGCDKPRHRCHIANKYDYDAAFAQRKYEELLTSSRQGIAVSRDRLHKMDEIIMPLIGQGQSPYHILCNHPELDVSVKTLYNYIDMGALLVKNVDLKRKVKFKVRKSKKKTFITEGKVFIGRTYKDFKTLDLSDFTEMDTVISAGDCLKCILTFYFTDTGLFLAFLLNRCTQAAVKAVFDRLETALGTLEFSSLFKTILTDRGSEFGDPAALETDANGIRRTNIYYCDPMSSGQKGGIEEIHTLLRMVLPKKTVFSDLTQWDLRKIVNHINSYSRARLRGKTPYQCALEKFGEDVLNKMQLKPVPPDEVNLTPKLLKK